METHTKRAKAQCSFSKIFLFFEIFPRAKNNGHLPSHAICTRERSLFEPYEDSIQDHEALAQAAKCESIGSMHDLKPPAKSLQYAFLGRVADPTFLHRVT